MADATRPEAKGSVLFGPYGLIVAALLGVGSIYFVARSVREFEALGCAAPVAKEAMLKTDIIVDVFVGRDAFHLAHVWVILATWTLIRRRSSWRGWPLPVFLAFLLILGVGHWIAWRCSQVGVSFGIWPW